MAEDTGLIHPLGQLILEQVCEQASNWRREGIAIPIALNLSIQELRMPDLAERIARTLGAHGLDGSAIEIEITESTAMENASANVATLSSLREIGIGIFIDDFGTGYSSLSQLRQLPVDVLKVDRIFVEDMVSDPADADIVEIIVMLAGAMDLMTVAEGIESVEQFRTARQLGCELVQGYLFGRPTGAEEITPLLQAGRVDLPDSGN